METHDLFPERIKTSRLIFERFNHDTVDPFEFYEFVTRDEWQTDATEHMPWFRFNGVNQVIEFIDNAEQQFADCESARYLLRMKSNNEIIGTTAYTPEWESRRAGSDIVLSRDYWGNEYGVKRASVFIELTFETYDLDAYYTTCAADNDRSRRMIEKFIEKYGGHHEGLLRQYGSRHPDGTITDQHRFTILREEFKAATDSDDLLDVNISW